MCKKNTNPKNDEKENTDNLKNGTPITPAVSKEMLDKDNSKLVAPQSDPENIRSLEQEKQLDEQHQNNPSKILDKPVYTDELPSLEGVVIKR